MGKIDLPIQQPEKVQEVTVSKAPQTEPTFIDTPKAEVRGDNELDGIELIPLKKLFGVDALDDTYQKELQMILAWGNMKGYDRDTLNEKVREIRYRVGASDDMSEVRQVYQYIKINENIQDLVRKQRALEK